MKLSTLLLTIGIWSLLSLTTASAQRAEQLKRMYPPVDENKMIESRWKYAYALHTDNNTIIHRADDTYHYYLFWRFDYTYEQYLNGRLTKGTWSLNENELFYNFRNVSKFYIAEVTDKTMVLEFSPPNAKGTFQYHYVRVPPSAAPFERPANELPEVDVESQYISATKKRNARREKRRRKRRNRKRPEVDESLPEISIELVGGGYYGGIDPVIKDYITIQTNGRIIKEFKSVNKGETITKKNITREELEQLGAFIIAKGFFEYDNSYRCNTSLCQRRMSAKPTPIPLRIAVTYGERSKMVTIPIWGLDDKRTRYIEYPDGLDDIIAVIQKMAQEEP